MKARVFVTLKNGVLDPQGKAIGHALNDLGFGAVGEVRQGKVIDIELAESDEAKARASLKDMCEKLLANTVIEKYEIELKPMKVLFVAAASVFSLVGARAGHSINVAADAIGCRARLCGGQRQRSACSWPAARSYASHLREQCRRFVQHVASTCRE